MAQISAFTIQTQLFLSQGHMSIWSREGIVSRLLAAAATNGTNNGTVTPPPAGTGMVSLLDTYSWSTKADLASEYITFILLLLCMLLNLVPYIGFKCWQLFFVLTGFAPKSIQQDSHAKRIMIARWPLYATVNALGIYLFFRSIAVGLYSINNNHWDGQRHYYDWQTNLMIWVTCPNVLLFPIYGALTYMWTNVSLSMMQLLHLGLSRQARRIISIVVKTGVILVNLAAHILGIIGFCGVFYAATSIQSLGYWGAIAIFNNFYSIPNRIGQSLQTGAAVIVGIFFVTMLIIAVVNKARGSTAKANKRSLAAQQMMIAKVTVAFIMFTALWVFRIIGLALFVNGLPYHVWNTLGRTVPDTAMAVVIILLLWPFAVPVPRWLSKFSLIFKPIQVEHEEDTSTTSQSTSGSAGGKHQRSQTAATTGKAAPDGSEPSTPTTPIASVQELQSMDSAEPGSPEEDAAAEAKV